MLNERPNNFVDKICYVDSKPCEGQGTTEDCEKCAREALGLGADVRIVHEKLPKELEGLTHWNYRVVRTVDKDGTVEFGVYECYWAGDKFLTRLEEPTTSTYDNLDDLRRDAEDILAALDHPIIEEKP